MAASSSAVSPGETTGRRQCAAVASTLLREAVQGVSFFIEDEDATEPVLLRQRAQSFSAT